MTSIDRLPFTLNHYICPPGFSLLEFLNAVEAHGFAGIGLTERALLEMPAVQLRDELKARDLSVSSINTAGYFLHEGSALASQKQRNRELLEWSVTLGRAGLNVIVGGSERLSPRDARERVHDALGSFAEEAGQSGVPLMLEPLHPNRFRDKSCVNTLAHYRKIKESIPSLRLSADLFHLWWDPDLEQTLTDRSEALGVLQICDVVQEGGVLRRVPLDEGFVQWRAHVRQVRQCHPGVPLELELFADQLAGRSLEDLLSEAARILKDLDAG